MLGLMLSTTYVCFAQRFNANTVLISLWPAAALAVLRGLERNRIADGILAGLLVADFSRILAGPYEYGDPTAPPVMELGHAVVPSAGD